MTSTKTRSGVKFVKKSQRRGKLWERIFISRKEKKRNTKLHEKRLKKCFKAWEIRHEHGDFVVVY